MTITCEERKGRVGLQQIMMGSKVGIKLALKCHKKCRHFKQPMITCERKGGGYDGV